MAHAVRRPRLAALIAALTVAVVAAEADAEGANGSSVFGFSFGFSGGARPLVVEAADQGSVSARACAACHKDVYADWRATRHAVAFTNPVFLDGFAREPQARCVHCHAPLPRTLLNNAELLATYQQYVNDDAQQHHKAFDDLIRQHGIEPDAAHLLEGAPENMLPRFVRKHETDLLVMGAIARGRLDTILIGHTAERLLESVDCDLLVVKLPAEK